MSLGKLAAPATAQVAVVVEAKTDPSERSMRAWRASIQPNLALGTSTYLGNKTRVLEILLQMMVQKVTYLNPAK